MTVLNCSYCSTEYSGESVATFRGTCGPMFRGTCCGLVTGDGGGTTLTINNPHPSHTSTLSTTFTPPAYLCRPHPLLFLPYDGVHHGLSAHVPRLGRLLGGAYGFCPQLPLGPSALFQHRVSADRSDSRGRHDCGAAARGPVLRPQHGRVVCGGKRTRQGGRAAARGPARTGPRAVSPLKNKTFKMLFSFRSKELCSERALECGTGWVAGSLVCYKHSNTS